MAESDEKEPELIITDRRPRFDTEPETPSEAPSKGSGPDEPAHEAGHRHEALEDEVPAGIRLEQILAILSGMVLTHLSFDPESRLPDPAFSLKEARFFLDLMEKFRDAFRDRLPIAVAGEGTIEEPAKLGHIPAILGGMAISALGVDPRTGRPERKPDFESARFLIDLMDLFVREGEDALEPEEREYVKDMVYQAKMYFVRQRDQIR
jgi:hypothetical protein